MIKDDQRAWLDKISKNLSGYHTVWTILWRYRTVGTFEIKLLIKLNLHHHIEASFEAGLEYLETFCVPATGMNGKHEIYSPVGNSVNYD